MTTSQPRARLTARLELSATILVIVVALFVGGLTAWDRLRTGVPTPPPEPPMPATPVSIAGAPVRGDRNARVALIGFSDFECPYCGQAERKVIPEIEREYVAAGKVLLVWRHFPLPMHEHAEEAAEAAECARRQHQFWAFHDWAFQHQDELYEAGLRGAARALGFDVPAFGACLDGGEAAA